MTKQEYVVNINNELKISGSAEAIHELAIAYNLAACEYGHQIMTEIHEEHNDEHIAKLENEQKHFENIGKKLIDTIRDSDYYKKYSSEMLDMVNSVLEELD